MPAEVIAQKWDDQNESLVRTALRAPAAEVDVQYDALLANRRTLDDPELVSVQPGESVLLRLIAAASATNFYVDTGSLEAEILAVDGKTVRAGQGQILSTRHRTAPRPESSIPKDGGAFPILAQGGGDKTALWNRLDQCICMGTTSRLWKSTAKRYPAPCAIPSWFRPLQRSRLLSMLIISESGHFIAT
jgi:hypothetical protein